jgi:PAS domain S-box-containing protein
MAEPHDRRAHARLRDHIESALQHIRDHAVVLIDPDGLIVGWNRGAERLLGYAESAVLSQPVDLFFTPEDRRAAAPERERATAARTGESADERWHLRADGSRFYASGTLTAVRDETNRLIGFIKIFRDLTEQRRHLDQLAESEGRYRLLVGSIKDYAIFMLDAEGRVSYWTPAAERIKGYSSDEIVGKPFATFFTEEDRARNAPEHELQSAREQGHVEGSGWRVRKGGALFWAEEIATALHDASGALIGYSKITRDATERREAELERERLLREATEANRLKDEFLSTISHELRTPLNAILGWLQVVRLRNDIPDTLSEALSVIERNARTQGRLIEDLLDVSRIVTGKAALTLTRISFAEPLAAAIETVKPDANQKGINLEVHHDVVRDEILGDSERLQQVIWNLLSNAIKFTPRGGRVIVTTAHTNGFLKLTVADTGVGIEPEFLPLVFDRFRQAETSQSKQHRGLGLGLSIVKHFVDQHGGTITIDSAGRDQGTTVGVLLPRVDAFTGAGLLIASQVSPPPALRALTDLSVLVVDDDPDARRMLELVLTAQGARVSLSASAREAIEALRVVRPDVVLADVAMPSEDGFRLLTQIRADSRISDVPVVAVTAHAGEQDRARCIAAGFDSFMPKPVDMNHVIDTVASLARRQVPDARAD